MRKEVDLQSTSEKISNNLCKLLEKSVPYYIFPVLDTLNHLLLVSLFLLSLYFFFMFLCHYFSQFHFFLFLSFIVFLLTIFLECGNVRASCNCQFFCASLCMSYADVRLCVRVCVCENKTSIIFLPSAPPDACLEADISSKQAVRSRFSLPEHLSATVD